MNPKFDICCLYNNDDLLETMEESFRRAGFTDDNYEFMAGKEIDAYSAVNQFLTYGQSEYIILCHQDVKLLEGGDNRHILVQRLVELDELDPHWALAGNAGANRYRMIVRISEPTGVNKGDGENYPVQVRSLDENFIVVRREANLAVSRDLRGFHLWGTELCLVAEILGWTSYVIDFHLWHGVDGKHPAQIPGWSKRKDVVEAGNQFSRKWSRYIHNQILRTTCWTFRFP